MNLHLKWKDSWVPPMLLIALILAVAALTMAATSCTTTRYVTVPERHEVVVHQRDTAYQRDSIYVRDSVSLAARGDTVYLERFRIQYRDRWRDRLRVDSFIQRDTVTVVQVVEKPPSRLASLKQQLGSLLLWLTAAAVVWLAVSYVRSRK